MPPYPCLPVPTPWGIPQDAEKLLLQTLLWHYSGSLHPTRIWPWPLAKSTRASPQCRQIKSKKLGGDFPPKKNPGLLQVSQPSLLSHLQNMWPTVCETDQTHLPWKALWTLPWHPEQESHETPTTTFRPPRPHSWHSNNTPPTSCRTPHLYK